MKNPQKRGRGRPSVQLEQAEKIASGRPSGDGRVAPMPLASQAIHQLRNMIIEGELVPDQLLSETALSNALGISRTPIRQAFQQLSTEGLIVLRPNRGAVVAPLTIEETRSLFEALACIERSAAEYAAQRATPDKHERLAGLQEKLEGHHRDRDMLPYFEANQSIHRLIIEMAGNPVLTELHESLFTRAERARLTALRQRPRWDESVDEHRAILAALAGREAAKAGDLLAKHVQATGDAVVRYLSEEHVA